MKCSLGISNFLNRSLVFPILLFSSISFHWSLRKTFSFLLAILWNSAFKWVYLFFSPLPFASLLFIDICRTSSDNHFAFCTSFSWGWSPVQCHKPPSIVIQAPCLSDLMPWIYLSLPLYNHKRFDLGHTWSSGFPYFLQFKSEFGNNKFMIWATVSSQYCFCWLYRVSPSLAAKNIISLIWFWPSGDPCVESSLVFLEQDVCYDQCSLGKTLLAFALLFLYLIAKFACYSSYFLTLLFCIPVPYQVEDIFFWC